MQIYFTRTGVAGIGRRALQAVGRAAMITTATFWQTKFLPLHFTRRAFRLYGYKPRSGDPGSGKPFKGSYAESKVRRKANGEGVRAIGENKPFVFSGRSRDQAVNQSNVTATARNYQTYEGRVAIPANTLNFLRGRIDAAKEIRATNPNEEQQLERVFADAFELELNKVGRTNRVSKKIAA